MVWVVCTRIQVVRMGFIGGVEGLGVVYAFGVGMGDGVGVSKCECYNYIYISITQTLDNSYSCYLEQKPNPLALIFLHNLPQITRTFVNSNFR